MSGRLSDGIAYVRGLLRPGRALPARPQADPGSAERPIDDYLRDLLEPFGPTMDLAPLVEEINRVFHAAEAAGYDDHHPEIFDELPDRWSNMIGHIRSRLPERPLKVLDFGCGTGFASLQVINALGAARVGHLTCCDPSPEMLERCDRRLARAGIQFEVLGDEAELRRRVRDIDLVLTNSVLHHLHDPKQTARTLQSLASPQAFWIAGHEPSARFYRNQECVRFWQRYERWRMRRQLFSPSAYVAVLKRKLGLEPEPTVLAAREVFKRGWFRKQPTPLVIDRVVDLHVAHSPAEVERGRGLDADGLQREVASSWTRDWWESYSYLGPRPEVEAPVEWQRHCRELGQRYPHDGANFSTIWRRA